ncbi:MAG: ParB/RepB/Spo0J family partition protein [Gammaproteobacteria bacterium]
MQAIQGELLALSELGTSYGRVRCPAPRQVEQMKASLTTHGQLTALVVVKRDLLELIDGFKRHRAAQEMGWTRLRVASMEVDEAGQWAAMLALNRATHSMTVIEEALVLREMVGSGMTQTGIGQLLGRHKSWVSRRIGLIERLHPELMEQIREGILPPGAARRLLALPAGNQLELATVVTHERLGSQETELLVRLWRTANPSIREFLLSHPREALANARAGDPEEPSDPRLTPRGQRLQRHLRILQGVAPRTLQVLRPSPAEEDLTILARDLDSTTSSLSRLVEALGSVRPRGE